MQHLLKHENIAPKSDFGCVMESNRWRSFSWQPCTADEAVECKNAICWISKYDFRLAGSQKSLVL